MGTIGEDQEARILAGVCGMICARVQQRLPATKRGIRALEPILSRVPEAVRVALDRAVEEVAEQVSAEIEDTEPFAPEEEPT